MLKYLSRANGTILPDSEHHNESMNKLRHLAGGTERQEFMILSGQLNKHNCQPRCLGKLLNKRWDRGERMENGNRKCLTCQAGHPLGSCPAFPRIFPTLQLVLSSSLNVAHKWQMLYRRDIFLYFSYKKELQTSLSMRECAIYTERYLDPILYKPFE